MTYQEFLSMLDAEDRIDRFGSYRKCSEALLWKEIQTELQTISSERYGTLYPEARFLITLLISAGKSRDSEFIRLTGKSICELTRLHHEATVKIIENMWKKFPTKKKIKKKLVDKLEVEKFNAALKRVQKTHAKSIKDLADR